MKLSNEGKLKLAVHSALFAGLAVGSVGTAAAQEAVAATDAKATELDTIEVTGSRLKRSSLEGALPVTIIDRKTIDLSGDISVAELLRSMSLNSFGSFRQQSGSSAQGLAALDLRGLGSERTLILIDGKRAPKAPFAPTAQDLNAIPLGAVERIEILQDGASAIYGSDAIAGVVNIILRKDFQGTLLTYGAGYPSVIGGDTEQLGLTMGLPTANGNLVFGASYNTRDIIFSRHQVADGIGTVGRSGYGNNYVAPGIDPDGPGPLVAGSRNAVPGGCTSSDAFVLVPSASSVNGFRCQYDFTKVAANEASTKNMALFGKGNFNISQDWSFYTSGSVSRATSFGRYAPAPAVFFVPGDQGGAPMSGPSGIDHDSNGTFDDVYVYHRFDALGTRDDTVNGNVYDLLGGFQGTFGLAELDVGARYNEYKAITLGRNYVVLPIAEQFAADGSYDFANPLANSSTTLNSMKTTIARESTWRSKEGWGTATFNNLFQLPGGKAGLAAGLEYRTEQYFDQYDSLSEAGVIGGSAGNSAGKDRSVRGYFGELLMPLVDTLEVTLAARYDDYSDVGGQASPKISLRYQPMDILNLRASYGQGFRAPTLDVVSLLPSFSAEPVTTDLQTCIDADPTATFINGVCSVSTQVNTTIIANPDLAPEESSQYSFGFVVDPLDYMSVSLDYYSYKVEDLISYLSPTDLLEMLAAGTPLPPGLSITRDPAQGNRISQVVAGYANLGKLETSGVNLDVNMHFDLMAQLGRLDSRLVAGYILDYSFDGGRNLVGDPAIPQIRSTWTNSYSFNVVSAAWNLNYIDSQARSVSNGNQVGHIPSYTTHDVQLNVDLPKKAGTLTVGAQNVFEKRIPVNSTDGRPYNFSLYEAYGRVPYFRYTLRFN